MDAIGVNNRNLKTFQLNVETSKELAPLIGFRHKSVGERDRVTRSGNGITELWFPGVPHGTAFMENSRPEEAAMEFINKLNRCQAGKGNERADSIKLKICGMRLEENILEMADFEPDFMGFIFFKGSGRFVGDFEVPAALPRR